MSTLTIHTEAGETNGRIYYQFTPVLTPDICAQGSLRFAFWQCWIDEPWTHESAKEKALTNARTVLAEMSLIGTEHYSPKAHTGAK